ncbi:glutaredoxin family protein [Aquihabitans daechungensis]|uniref:glutaredoxin family protein n=1 Tax=Aquihabitans daechungensis TaxID=1052257 RepID=UPI003BA015B1
MTQLAIVVLVGALAGAIAWYLQRRTTPEPERGSSWTVPELVNRDDFVRPDAPWLVVLFSSSTCLACRGTAAKAELLESDSVAFEEVDHLERKDLHDRYGIDAVPLLLLVDPIGSVRRSFVGEPSATDLWAALAELREPGSVPPGCDHSGGCDHD